MDLFLVLALLLGTVVGFLAGSLRGHGVRAELAGALARAQRLEEETAELRDRAARDADVLRALAPVQESLTRMREQVALLERERIEQFSALTSQLTHAHASHEELRRTTSVLASALKSSSARGQWGEVELRRILEAAGMLRHVDFTTQESLADGSRPDALVRLPGGRTIPIDAKVPFDAYLQAAGIDGHDPAAVARRRDLESAHAKALRAHVDALAGRDYHGRLGNAELTVMFIPSEGLLAAALTADPGLLEYALRKHVSPASPASLLALLRSVAAVWAHEQVSDEAQQLLALGRTLYERLGVVAGHMGTLGRSLRSSVAAYNKAVSSMESRLLVTARELESIAGAPLEVAEVEAAAAQVREFTAAVLAP